MPPGGILPQHHRQLIHVAQRPVIVSPDGLRLRFKWKYSQDRKEEAFHSLSLSLKYWKKLRLRRRDTVDTLANSAQNGFDNNIVRSKSGATLYQAVKELLCSWHRDVVLVK